MEQILAAWQNTAEYRDARSALSLGQPALISGLPLPVRAIAAATLFLDSGRPQLLLAADEEEALQLYENLLPILGKRALHFPVLELLPFEVYAHNIELTAARVGVLTRLLKGEPVLVVASVSAVTRKLIPPAEFAKASLCLRKGQVFAPAGLARALADLGYERASLTEIPGTFSMRGSLIDVFPLTAEQPARLEFFDDEIDSIRFFDPSEQLSGAAADELAIGPAREMPLTDQARQRARQALAEEMGKIKTGLHGPAKKELEKTFSPLLEFLEQRLWDNGLETLLGLFYPDACAIFDYLRQGMVVISEPQGVKQASLDLKTERDNRYFDLLGSGRLLPSFYYNFLEYGDLFAGFSNYPLLLLCQLSMNTGGVRAAVDRQVMARELPVYAQNPQLFHDDVLEFHCQGYQVVFAASSELRLQRMSEILAENGLPPARLLKAGFTAGFESPGLKLALITERELFARQNKKRHRRVYKGGEKIANFLDLRSGDYVVHIYQGIGQYLGVERLTVGEIQRDYLLIQYAGEDKLYVPVDQLDLIQKYIGGDGAAPKLYKLGGGEWARVKAKAQGAVHEMAEELLKLYAEREQTPGYAFAPDSAWQREFEDAFPYEETPDQLQSEEEIKQDMEQPRIMDRLLCGDVGYGKTEIALRAAFKAMMDGKQAAILAPTTVLTQQHYHTILQRFAGYPIRAGFLSRFSTPAQQKETLKKLAAGETDIVVGTHRLLSKDVRFKDLGLLIIDEEQRFGVAHKEKIKQLKKQVDVLTLSATPIPRTLHMALVGMREMSVINTPPEDRHPVQTYVVEYNKRLLRDAIAREMARGGQVYFVHNRVHNIYETAADLQQLLPSARIAVAHGQMKEKGLEQVMMDFVDRQADVLVCTTIIESGLDIGNVNTLIVDDADMFGLAQLYQLRGRVGRTERQAFAYFTYRRERTMNEIAKKRLIAIRDFTELGAGFKIAMRDLELRGAGNILGPEQHGHIMAVGFDLYCKLLEEEMEKARGREEKLPELSTQMELAVNAFIPDTFIDSSMLKVEIYKRIAAVAAASELDELAEELRDRYGPLPDTVRNLLLLGKLKLLARGLRIAAITQKQGFVELRFGEQAPLTGEALIRLAQEWDRVSFSEKKLKKEAGGDSKAFFIKVSTEADQDGAGLMNLLLELLARLTDLCQDRPELQVG